MLLNHNQIVYNEAVQCVRDGIHDILITQDTGTGKSYICVELLKTIFKDKKVLYVVPKWSIAENFKSVEGFSDVEGNIEFATYNSFTNDFITNMYFTAYDVFVVDEAHHLGSDRYGNNTLNLLNKVKVSNNKYFIGLTATPVREDKVDVSKFFSKRIQGITLFECIQAELINPFDYIVCSSNFIDSYRELIFRNIINIDGERLKYKYDFTNSRTLLTSIVNENPRNKWIVYFHSYEKLLENKQMLVEIFSGYKIIEFHSYADNDNEIIKEIRNSEKVVILTIDMLSEGVHISGVEGIILFRNVGSLVLFRQILGRVSSMNKNYNPIVIDCTNVAMRMLRKLDRVQRENASKERKFYEKHENIGIFNVKLDNKDYFDIMSIICKMSDGFEYNGKYFSSYNEFCETYKLSASDFCDFRKALPTNILKEDACKKYLDFLDSKKFEFKGKYYIDQKGVFQLIAKDNGYDEVDFCTVRSHRKTYYRKNGMTYNTKTLCEDYEVLLKKRELAKERKMQNIENKKPTIEESNMMYIEKELSKIGFSKSQFSYFLKSHGIELKGILANKEDCIKALNSYKDFLYYYDGKYYVRKSEVLRKANVEYKALHHFVNSKNLGELSFEEQLSLYKKYQETKKNPYPFLKGTEFKYLKDFCLRYNISCGSFSRWYSLYGNNSEDVKWIIEQYKMGREPITYKGKTYNCKKDLYKEYGFTTGQVISYLEAMGIGIKDSNIPFEEKMNLVIKHNNELKDKRDNIRLFKEACDKYGLRYNTVKHWFVVHPDYYNDKISKEDLVEVYLKNRKGEQ